MLRALQAATADSGLGLAEVSDELYLDFVVSAMAGGNRGPEFLETGLAHVAVRLEEDGMTALEHMKPAVPLPEVQRLS